MKSYNIYPYRSDLILDNEINNDINKYDYKTILFNDLNEVKDKLKKELHYFFNKLNVNKNNHIFIVGLGNENLAADSVGPKSLKHIKVNSYLKNLEIDIKGPTISALEPGVMGETGILTEKIIESVSNEIKPDLVILIDSFVSSDINYLNKTIQITDAGLNTGDGLKCFSSNIDRDILNVPVLVIGVPTAVEIKFTNDNNSNFIPYLLCSKDVDSYVNKISEIIGISINETINEML